MYTTVSIRNDEKRILIKSQLLLPAFTSALYHAHQYIDTQVCIIPSIFTTDPVPNFLKGQDENFWNPLLKANIITFWFPIWSARSACIFGISERRCERRMWVWNENLSLGLQCQHLLPFLYEPEQPLLSVRDLYSWACLAAWIFVRGIREEEASQYAVLFDPVCK